MLVADVFAVSTERRGPVCFHLDANHGRIRGIRTIEIGDETLFSLRIS